MAETTTTRLGLRKPTPGTGDPVNRTKMNEDLDSLDNAAGFLPVTSTTRPSTPFAGQGIRETDTDRHYIHNGSSPASAGWRQILTQGGSFFVPAGGTTASVRVTLSSGAASANRALAFRGAGETFDHWFIDVDGKMQWSSGSAGADTNLYRSAADTLRTDDALSVGGALAVTGVASFTANVAWGASGVGAVEAESATTGSTASTSYVTNVTTAGVLGVPFVAPPSGKVLIHFATHFGNNTLNGNSYCAPQVRTGSAIDSGTLVLTASDAFSLRNQSSTSSDNDAGGLGRTKLLTGLTPGNSYNACLAHRVNAGTQGLLNRSISVVPTI